MVPRTTKLALALLCVSLLFGGLALATSPGPTATTAPSASSASSASCLNAGPTTGSGIATAATPNSSTTVSVWTAPRATFGDFQTPAAVQAAIEQGLLTPASAGWEDTSEHADFPELGDGDTFALFVNVSGDATQVFDHLAAADGNTSERRLVNLLGDPGIEAEGFDLLVGVGMCENPVNWSASAEAGALNVVPDRDNGTLYIALDSKRAFYDLGAKPNRDITSTVSVRISPPDNESQRIIVTRVSRPRTTSG